MDMTFLLQYIDLVTMGLCLCLGYALKTSKIFEKFGNNLIPITMMFVGLVISIVTNLNNITSVVLLSGMISGLASTGFYEMLRNFIEKNNKSE